MDCVYGKFRYGPSTQIVALYPSIQPEELTAILKATLPILGDILGVQDEERTVIPLSLLCRTPSLLSNKAYGILVSVPPPTLEASVPAAPLPSAPPLAESESINRNPSSPFTVDSQLSQNALADILSFISLLKTKEYISRAECDALEYLLSMNSSLLPAAYSVAKSTKDSRYFAQICKDIAESMMDSPGQAACSAQEDVLECCDQLYVNNQINEEQLLYLRHLVLIRDNDIADLYDQFLIDKSPENLIKGLCVAAGAFGASVVANAENKSPDQVVQESESPQPLQLRDIIKTLPITPVQGLLLSYLIKEQDRKVVAAVNQYQGSGDQDALRRHLTQIAQEEDQKMREEEEKTNDISNSSSSSSEEQNDDNDDEEEDEEDAELLLPRSPVANSRVDALLASLNESNRWKDTVPSRFILAVFAAAQRNLLTVGHACGLCDLFANGNELVVAAWEVFTSQGDVIDFIDTLRRIVKFAENELQASADDDSSADTVPLGVDPSKRKSTEVDVQATEKAREEALEAVSSAKRELLKHSLDLLAKQGLISSEAAIKLFRHSLEEDGSQTDAAIESYAVSKDMMQFLKSLIELATAVDNKNPQKETSFPAEDLHISGALMTIAEHLRDENIIPENVYSNLVNLIKNQNQDMKSAWIKYREQKCELTDVVDVMLRLSLKATDDLPIPSSTPATAAPPPNATVPAPSSSRTPPSVLSTDDYKHIVDIYLGANALPSEDKPKLYQLIDSNNPQMKQIFNSFENHRDVHKLLIDLQGLLKDTQLPDAEEEEVESKFLSIVKKMNLSSEETGALREAIAHDDPLLRSALELYRSDQNEGNLMTNLKAISQRIMKSSPSRRQASSSASSSSPAPAPASASPASSRGSAASAPESKAPASVSPPIQDIFPILLNEFVKHKIFTAEKAASLRQLYDRDDEVLGAALELYELDHDLAGLVGSLEKILRYV